jgi:hypothetical protein
MASTIGLLIGFAIVPTVIYSGYKQGWFANPCPSTYGRECNAPYGTCQPDGTCLCDILFSGAACTNTLCPGYNPVTGIACYNNGECNPLMQPPAECWANSVVKLGLDWTLPDCVARVAANRLLPFSPNVSVETPTCICRGDYGPPSCAAEQCPFGVSNTMCSGNGNTSVGFLMNGTAGTGMGCQCSPRFSFHQALAQVSSDVLLDLEQHHFAAFLATDYCGTLYQDADDPDYIVVDQTTVQYTCCCDALHKGLACDLGVCPELNGIPCANRGHPSFGQGLETNTTNSVSIMGTPCVPNCMPGLQYCSGTCQESCLVPLKCPLAQPYRCSSGYCAAAGQCSSVGVSAGTLEHLELARGNYLDPAPVLNFTTPVTFFSLIAIDAPVQITVHGTYTFSSNGGALFASIPLEYAYDHWQSTGATVVFSQIYDGGIVELSPAPFIFPAMPFSEIRLRSPSNVFIMDALKSRAVVVNSGFEGMLLIASGPLGYLNAGTFGTLDACLAALSQCAFTDNSSIPSGLVIQGVYTVFTARPRGLVSDYTGKTWQLEVPVPNWVYNFTITGGNVTQLEVITADDLQSPCACLDLVGVNQSVLNAEWAVQASRLFTPPGEYAVVPYRAQGDAQLFRVTVLNRDSLQALVSAPGLPKAFYAPLSDVYTISTAEFEEGLPDCDATVFPLRCADGSCASLGTSVLNVNSTCTCTGSTTGIACDCQDELGNFSLACPGATCDPAPAGMLFAEALSGMLLSALDECTCALDVVLLESVGPLAPATTVAIPFARPERIVAISLDLNTSGLVFENLSFPIQILVQAQSTDLSWRTVANRTSAGNSSGNVTLNPIYGPGPWIALRLWSFAPFTVNSMEAYTDQECTCDAVIAPPAGPLPPLPVGDGCVCTNTCQLQSGTLVMQPFDGVCSDVIAEAYRLGIQPSLVNQSLLQRDLVYVVQRGLNLTTRPSYNYSDGILSVDGPNGTIIVNVTAMGTSANDTYYSFNPANAVLSITHTVLGDCGCSTRQVAIAPGQTCSGNLSLDQTSGFTLYGVVLQRQVINITANCPFACPFTPCVDGSCSLNCTGILYNCPGNGCVDAGGGAFFCACDLGYGGQICEYGACVPGSSDNYARCACNGPPPLKQQPPYASLIERTLTTTEIT